VMKKFILVTGGAGYIGSHMAKTLSEAARPCVVFDNLSTGNKKFIPKDVPFVEGDLRNKKEIVKVFKRYSIELVMHFAASIVVPESVKNPLKYYENNVTASINLLEAMLEQGVKRFIFSSTAAVYGEPKTIPVTEEDVTEPKSPYGASKLMVERILQDMSKTHDFSYIILRYFNACGAHPSGTLGPTNKHETLLIPNIIKVASGKAKELNIYGDDYPTPDGTCLRDYIHVMDLCQAHLLACDALKKGMKSDLFNLGNEKGFSVKEVVAMVEKVTGRNISVKISARRPGDPARIVASGQKARKLLGWQPKMDLSEIISTAWKWELARTKRNFKQ